MGFDMRTFKFIINAGFEERWHSRPIPHNDACILGNSCPGARSLDAKGTLGLILHYLNSTMLKSSLQQLFGLIPTTVSCYITFSLGILLEILQECLRLQYNSSAISAVQRSHHSSSSALRWGIQIN
jgi:hypothetical protein